MTSPANAATPLRVGVVGLGWMGQVHARAYTRVVQHYLDSPLRPVLVAVADNAGDERLARSVAAYGFTDVDGRLPTGSQAPTLTANTVRTTSS